MSFRIRALLLLIATSLAMPLLAHDTWLLPEQFRVPAAGPVALSLSSGMDFPTLDHAIAPERVASAKWQSARNRGELPKGTSAKHALEFHAEAGEGVTGYSVELHARPSSLKREQVREYIDHLGIPNADDVFAAWQQTANAGGTGYRYFKYAKAFVRHTAADSSDAWSRPAGMLLELVPQNDPTSVKAGGMLEVLLLDGGKPLRRYPVALLREGSKDVVSTVTDDQGRARLTLPASGRYMLRATTLEPSADSNARWDVHFTTLTLDVEAAR